MIDLPALRNASIHVAAGVALVFTAATPALGDDTEVLLGARIDPGAPNITFIIDTSGSMNSDVVIGEDYDPARTYVGTCSTDRYYWRRASTGRTDIPDCTLATWIETSALRCAAAKEVLATSGVYRDRFAQWDDGRAPFQWETITFARTGIGVPGESRPTECREDEGVHGAVPGEYYIADGSAGPWTTEAGLRKSWDETGDLYTFYHANYLNWIQESGESSAIQSRIDIVKRVARDVITPLTNVNIAMMRFSTDSDGGMVLHDMVPVDEGRSSLLATIDAIRVSGGTPLAETLYEAGQYYGNRPVVFGLDSVGFEDEPLPSVAASRDGDNYDTPIENECQRNYVVLLTDGFPANDTDADGLIERLPGFAETVGSCSGDSCLDEMSRYLNEIDQLPGAAMAGKQTVQTYTIGFHTEQDLLADTATGVVPVRHDDGTIVIGDDGSPVTRPGYFTATDREGLTEAFESIIEAIRTTGESYTSPSLAVDVQNRLTNREDVFLAMFRPAERGEPHWDGNLKKYRFGRPRGASPTSTPRIIDANGRSAVGDDGLFIEGAQSFWSTEPDAGDVVAGGFIETLTTRRNVYSNIGSRNLWSGENHVVESNDELTASLLGLEDPDTREAVIRWARGVKDDGTARAVVGDPLHSEPTIVAYSGDRFALFFGTNDGFLHALNPEPATRGVKDIEHFAFVPRELLPLLDTMRRNEPSARPAKAYGLDGPIRVWIDEGEAGNDVVESGEKAYLYAGMRRGGRNYYALDITDVEKPRLVWTIRGGSGDFAELGQTWSAPIKGRISIDGVRRDVLFFAGGNDPNQDSRDRPVTADDMGRAVFIVDARTGERLWWASSNPDADLVLEDMTHSLPSDLRVLDTDGDGLDDRIYVGDTTAQMWRFDIDNSPGGRITGGMFATVGGSGEAGNRRIYYPPSITRVIDDALGSFLTISFGTGHRAHPLERDVADAFFMIRDPNPFVPPVDLATGLVDYGTPVTPDDLLDVTRDADPSTTDLVAGNGWFIQFEPSEKNISGPIAVLNRIFFTTYLPGSFTPTCSPTPIVGSGRLYAVDILTGAPVSHADSPTPADRYRDLSAGGLPPTPRLVFTEPVCEDCDPSETPVSEITMLVGTESIDPGILNIPHRTYWVQEDVDR